MALQNDLPQITQLRDSLESKFVSHRDNWKLVFQTALAVGEIFADENQNDTPKDDHHEE